MLTDDDIKQIYLSQMKKNAEIMLKASNDVSTELYDNFWSYLSSHINIMVNKITQLYADNTIPQSVKESVFKDFSTYLDTINQNTLPEVIEALFIDEMRETHLNNNLGV